MDTVIVDSWLMAITEYANPGKAKSPAIQMTRLFGSQHRRQVSIPGSRLSLELSHDNEAHKPCSRPGLQCECSRR